MKLKIISDGTVIGTNLINIETGEKIGLVQKITFAADAHENPITRTTIEILNIPVEMNNIDSILEKIDYKEDTTKISKQMVNISSKLDETGFPITKISNTETDDLIDDIQSISASIWINLKQVKQNLVMSRDNASFNMEEWKELILKKYETDQNIIE